MGDERVVKGEVSTEAVPPLGQRVVDAMVELGWRGERRAPTQRAIRERIQAKGLPAGSARDVGPIVRQVLSDAGGVTRTLDAESIEWRAFEAARAILARAREEAASDLEDDARDGQRRADSAVEAHRQERERAERAAAAASLELERTRGQLDALERQTEATIAGLTESRDRALEELARRDRALEEGAQTLQRVREQNERLGEEVAALNDRGGTLERELATLGERLEGREAAIARLEQERIEARAENEVARKGLEARLESRERQGDAAREALASARAENERLRAELDQLSSENRTLRETIESGQGAVPEAQLQRLERALAARSGST